MGARDAIDSILANPGTPPFPTGPTDIYSMPGWPEGTIAVTPQGDLMHGTGGSGELAVHQGTVADVIGMPVPDDDALADVDEEAAESLTSGAVLLSSKENRSEMHYRVNGQNFTIQPGQRQPLPVGHRYVVEFDRGGGFGSAKDTVEHGAYAFTETSRGWELRRQTYHVTIDNSENRHDFHYLFNGEETVVRARQRQEHTSSYPVVVAFDRGNGGEAGRKRLETGVYRVGLDMESRRIDLFPGDDSAQRVARR